MTALVRRSSLRTLGVWVCLTAVGILPGCGPGQVQPDSGVRGRVLVGPACPVVQAGETCPDQPVPARLEVTDAAGKIVARGAADGDGEFILAVPEGRYQVLALAADGGPFPWATPVEIVVVAGGWTEVTLMMDSGIR